MNFPTRDSEWFEMIPTKVDATYHKINKIKVLSWLYCLLLRASCKKMHLIASITSLHYCLDTFFLDHCCNCTFTYPPVPPRQLHSSLQTHAGWFLSSRRGKRPPMRTTPYSTDLTTDIVTNCCAVRRPSVTVPIRKETEKWNRTHRPQHRHGGACVSSWQHAVFTQQQGRWETKLLLPAHNVKAAQLETKTILCCGDGVFRHKHGGGDGDGVTVT